MSKTCLVRFDNKQYSVMSTAVGHPVDVYAYADRIVVKQNGTIVGDHPRSFERNHVEYNPYHYPEVLTKKPVPLRNRQPSTHMPRAIVRLATSPTALKH